jgi:hypothetical protein
MPGERVTMRKVREVLRLKFDGNLSNRKIGKSCCLGNSTVADYLERFRRSGLSWPLWERSRPTWPKQSFPGNMCTASPCECSKLTGCNFAPRPSCIRLFLHWSITRGARAVTRGEAAQTGGPV